MITLDGVNHFGITDVNMPEGAIPDPIPQLLSQEASVETIARWSSLFLRGTLLDDQDALDYVFNAGESIDPLVISVEAEQASVPEPVSLVAVAGGLLSLVYLRRAG